MSDFEISTDRARLQLDVIHAWLRESYWSPRIRRDVLDRAYANSVVVGAYRGAHQIGVARAVTDHATFAWIADVYVDAGARGHGIATAMMQTLLDHPSLQTLRRWTLATRDAHAVYQPFGFAPCDPAIFMQRLMPDDRWNDTPSVSPRSA
jgi:GNAT superfamily N-acetyltransferase